VDEEYAMREMTDVRVKTLRQMLLDHRHGMQNDVQSRMRDVRNDRTSEVLDALENSDADTREDIAFALIQIKTETLRLVNAALVRLDAGDYGYCFTCGDEISEKRLRALPFAVRCTACEAEREQGEDRARPVAHRLGGSSLFADASY
jgi:DnaK suppressor protein